MNIIEASNNFLVHCTEERQLATNTISAYRQDLGDFSLYFKGATLESVTGEALVEFAAHLKSSRQLAPATVRRRVACLKSMFSWLVRHGAVAINPFATVELNIRLPDRLPRCLRSSEMSTLAAASERSCDLTRLATLLLFATGARISELTAVRLSDVDLEGGTIRIVGKGNRERCVYVTNDAVRNLLRSFVAKHRARARTNDHLFVSERGTAATPASVRLRLSRLSQHAGLARRVTPHMLRHTAATSLIEAGVDMRFVQRLLGHRSIATTQMYTHVSDSALRSAIARADTIARLRLAL